MFSLPDFTLGNTFKNDTGDILKVVANFGEGKKIYIELERVEVVVPPEDEFNQPISEI
jgi:hypothetical protein